MKIGQYRYFVLLLLTWHQLGWTQTHLATTWSGLELFSPVRHSIRLSGTFGELRSEHFHQGIDIKSSRGSSGDPVFAIAEGYISRISISAGGYGNAVFVTHPNGMTSVYAHLESFPLQLAKSIEAEQYARESFTLDWSLPPDSLPVSGGELLGTMGSSGHSYGPHLHFELRDDRTGSWVNPLTLGFLAGDVTSPIVEGIWIYLLDHEHHTYRRQVLEPDATDKDTFSIDAWRIGLGVETFDPHNRGLNRNGIYRIAVRVDDKLVYQVQMDEMSERDASSYFCHLDYVTRITSSTSVHTCFRKNGNQAQIYPILQNDGVIPLFKDRLQHITIETSDYHENVDKWECWLRRSEEVSVPKYPLYHKRIAWERGGVLSQNGVTLAIPRHALIEDAFLSVHQFDSSAFHFPVIQFAPVELPILNSLELSMPAMDYPPELRSKTVVMKLNSGSDPTYLGGSWNGDHYETSINTLGVYTLGVDSVAPKITLVADKETKKGRLLRFQVSDREKYVGRHKVVQYRVMVDERWYLAKYDLKSNQIECLLEKEKLGRGEHLFSLSVSDYVGNKNIHEFRFRFN